MLATVQQLRGNGQFGEARAKECNPLRNYATSLSLDRIQKDSSAETNFIEL